MELQQLWFIIVGVLFLGFFILEGFDFGVGMLMAPLGRVAKGDAETHRRGVLNTIGPVWDGNEVWLITAAGAMFAAFPDWYATVFSTLYLPLLAILVGMIVRVVAIEWRGKIDDARWRAWADAGIAAGSWLPAILWGVAFAVLVRGLPVDANHHVQLSISDVLNAYTLLGGMPTAGLFFFRAGRRTEVCDLAVATRHRAGRGLRTVDAGDAWQELDVGCVAHRGCCSTDRGCAGVGAPSRGLGLLLHHCRRRDGRGAAVRCPLPEPGPVDAGSRVERHNLQRVVEPLHAEDHDLGCSDFRTTRGRVSGMDVLGVPQADLR